MSSMDLPGPLTWWITRTTMSNKTGNVRYGLTRSFNLVDQKGPPCPVKLEMSGMDLPGPLTWWTKKDHHVQ